MTFPGTVETATRGTLARIGRAMRAPFRLTLDIALPPLCPACRSAVGESLGLCAQCWSKLSPIAPPYCPRLGIPFAYDPGSGIPSPIRRLTRERAPPCAMTTSRAAWCMRLNTAIASISRPLWRAGWRAGRELLSETDVIVPVPLHWRRLWARRFNQSASLAKIISGIAGRPVGYHSLKRVKATPQQVGLSRAERALNVQGAFRVMPDGKAKIAGRRVLLIDDVLTSVATADACSRALLRAGANSVDVLVFARVVEAARTPI
jgi:ComF family protein